MSRLVTPVVVLTRHNEILYDWATEAKVNGKGELRIYQGLKQRAFHPPGEWTQYTVSAPKPMLVSGDSVKQGDLLKPGPIARGFTPPDSGR